MSYPSFEECMQGADKACKEGRFNEYVNGTYKPAVTEEELLMEQVQKKIEKLQNTVKLYEHALNDMKRICRERANKDRKLQSPKKNHGYVLLSSGYKSYRFDKGKYYKCYYLKFQTPWESSIDIDVVARMITEDLATGKLLEGKVTMYNGPLEKLDLTEEYAKIYIINALTTYTANHRQGYYTVEFALTEKLDWADFAVTRGIIEK